MNLWDWALAAWARPGVERACLDLQDRAGQSVALLLWGVWSATHRRAVDSELASHAAALVRPIEIDVLRPLRQVRRSLAQSKPALDGRALRDAHAQVRATELNLERALLDALELQTSVQRDRATADEAGSVRVVMETWKGEVLDDDDRVLVHALMEALA